MDPGDVITFVIKGNPNGGEINGGIVDKTVENHNIPWKDNLDSAGRCTFTVTVPADYSTTDAELQLWWPNNGSASLISCTITRANPEFTLTIDQSKIRIGDTATLTCDGTNVQYYVSDESIAEIANNVVTAKSLGSVTITAKAADGRTRTVDLEIVGDLSVVRVTGGQTQYESALMGLNSSLQLTLQNSIGTVTWALAGDSPTGIVEVDANGNVTSSGTAGTATIVATDSFDNTTAQFTIHVQNIGIEPDLPTGAEFVQYIELNAAGDWSAIVNNLPYTNESGDTYYYYIAECDENGNIVTSINGNGARYIPVEYVNGLALSKDEANRTQLSVTNKMVEELQGSMPSTGGEGTTWYNITGMIIILSSTAVYILFQRRRKGAVK